ncbi:MAG: hypothetical protein Q7R73_02375 [bacterium]|nr:hypothetical protein [bacterium]
MHECKFRSDWVKRLFRCEDAGCEKTTPLIAGAFDFDADGGGVRSASASTTPDFNSPEHKAEFARRLRGVRRRKIFWVRIFNIVLISFGVVLGVSVLSVLFGWAFHQLIKTIVEIYVEVTQPVFGR